MCPLSLAVVEDCVFSHYSKLKWVKKLVVFYSYNVAVCQNIFSDAVSIFDPSKFLCKKDNYYIQCYSIIIMIIILFQ